MTASLRALLPQMSATIQVGSPLLWGAICAAATHRGAFAGRLSWIALLLVFPLLWARGTPIPGAAGWIAPLACWTATLLAVRSRRRTLSSVCMFATGASTSALQLWQLSQ
jgi:hypothetical protein